MAANKEKPLFIIVFYLTIFTISSSPEPLPFQTPPQGCSSDESFQCSDTECIPRRLVCDRFADCENATDERSCNNTEGWANAGTYGRDFVFAWPQTPLSPNTTFVLSVLSVSNHTAEFTIEIPGTDVVNEIVQPFHENFSKTIDLSTFYNEIDIVTVRVRSDNDISVTAVTTNPKFTNAFQVIPVASVGWEYYVPLISNTMSGMATMPGIATVTALSGGGTLVSITFSRNVSLNGKNVNIGSVIMKTLLPIQTYQLKVTAQDGDGDIVVMHVQANKSVSVVSGSVCASIPPGTTCDYLAEQFPPFNQWGRHFTIPSFVGRKDYSLLVIAGRRNTSVKVTNASDVILNEGDHSMELFTSGESVRVVVSDEPVLVVIFSTSWVYAGIELLGDPSISVIPPHDQFIHGVQNIYIYPFENIPSTKHRLAVTAACESMDRFILDDQLISVLEVNETRVAGGDMCVYHVTIEPGVHTVRLDTGTYMLMSYGFSSRVGYSHITSFNTQPITCQAYDDDDDETMEYECKDVKQDHCSGNETSDKDGNLIVWPQTKIFHTARPSNDSEMCPLTSSRAGRPVWSRRCILTDELDVKWREPENDCGEEIKVDKPEDLQTAQVTESNVEEISSTLQNVTEEIDEISSNDILAVADTLTKVVETGSTSKTVAESVVGTVNAVINDLSKAEVNDDDAQFNTIDTMTSTAEMIVAMETQIVQVLEVKDEVFITDDVIQVKAFHVAVEVEPVDVPIEPELEKAEDAFTSVVLPKEIFASQETTVSVATSTKIEKLVQPIVLNFPLPQNNRTISSTTLCVFWDFDVGDWSDRGCNYAGANDESVQCKCNHLTNFAVLMDYMDEVEEMSEPYRVFLDVLTKIGCTVSIIGLLVTLTIFYAFKRLRTSRPRRILVHLCVALLCLYITFLFGIDNAARSKWACPMVAALIHYFLLCAIFWMGVEALNIYLMLVRVFNMNISRFVMKGAIVAWGGPLLIVTICLAASTEQYSNNGFCFLRQGNVFYVGLITPMALILSHNIIIFLLVFRNLMNANLAGTVHGKKTDMDLLKERLQNALTMTILMGLTWSFGFLMIGHTKFIFQLLFCLLNSFQGLLVFVLFCWRQEDVRKVLRPHCLSAKRKSQEVVGAKADYDVTSTMTGHQSAARVSTEVRRNVTSTGSTSSTVLLSPIKTKGNNNLKDPVAFV